MNDSQELALIRTELCAAIERDLRNRASRVPLMHRRSFRFGVPTLAAVALATVAIVLGLTVSAASPSSASAAARRALAATTAAPSGTMTTTVLHAGVSQTVDAVRWNGDDIAFSPDDGSIAQLLLVGGGMYVQTSDGTWLHYADAAAVPPKPLGGLAQLARFDIAATTVQQILALGMHVGNDGLVTQLSITFQQQNASSPALEGAYTWSVTYNQLGSTPPITAPPSSTDVPPGTLPPGTTPPNTPGQNTRGSRLPPK